MTLCYYHYLTCAVEMDVCIDIGRTCTKYNTVKSVNKFQKHKLLKDAVRLIYKRCCKSTKKSSIPPLPLLPEQLYKRKEILNTPIL